ncbi:hypothetical protein JJD41_14820 [Oxynema sp. CENA135]|nr:hypothetical protein [Oxynema sp. CENA135]
MSLIDSRHSSLATLGAVLVAVFTHIPLPPRLPNLGSIRSLVQDPEALNYVYNVGDDLDRHVDLERDISAIEAGEGSKQ